MKRRILSIITALALCLSLCPTWALAAEADPSLCKHHPEHTEDCGYTAPTEGQPCGHQHTAECYTLGVLPDADSGDPYEIGGDTENLLDCQHSHNSECGYVQADPGAPCGYVCHICPIEDLIAALPEQVTEDNAADVRAQLDRILDLYRELNEDEQEEINLSRCYALQGALDAANAPVQAAEEINISQTPQNILTAEDGGCQGHTFTGTAINGARIYVESGAHNVTFSGLNITASAEVGIAPGATMNLTIEGTNTISAVTNYAGIYVPTDATLIINGTGSLNVSGDGSAGIGGAAFVPDEYSSSGNPNCGTVEIKGGTVTATGGRMCAGIGGGMSADYSPGNGGTVTISGGTVTAAGGVNNSGYGGAGIGGSAGETATSRAGSGGSLTISGGHVTLTAGNSTSYGFGQGTGKAPGGTCELTLTDASYLTVDSLDPNGKYTINGDPTADMIVVPEGLVYTGQALDVSGIKIDDTKTGTGTYFNQTFTVKASKDGWNYTISPAEVKEAGNYTLTFSKEGHTSISKTFTVAKSGTDLTEGKVQTYNGDTPTKDFTAGDTITVKATPTATGAAPTNSAMFAASFTPPTTGQMAVFVSDTQVSAPVGVGADGTYTMTVSASDVLTLGGVEPNGDPITLTAKFVENNNMADGTGTATVNITAVAVAEKDGKVIGYYGESNLDDAFTNDSATVTLLANVERTNTLNIKVNCTLDLGGHNITFTGTENVWVQGLVTAMTIRGEGEIISEQGHALVVTGSVTLEGGTFTSNGENCAGVYVNSAGASLSVTGEYVTIRNTGGGYGLAVNYAQSVQLSAGTYKGEKAVSIVSGTTTLGDLLNQEGASRVAYYKDNTTLVTEGLDGKELTGTVTVKACTHTGEGVCTYTHNENTSTHTKTCLACGYTETGDCGFEKTADPTADNHTGQCPLCKRDQSGAHSFSEWSGNPVARVCTVCGYEQTAVAKVEKSNSGGTEYMTVKGLNTVFASNSDYEGATVTLLDDVTITEAADRPRINIRCTLNLNGHTIRSDTVGAPPLEVSGYGNVTITGNGKVVSNSNIALLVLGTVVLEGGTFSSGVAYSGAVEVMSGNLSVTGENVVMENTGSGNGLLIYSLESVKLSAGKYSGAAGAISVSADGFTLGDLLNQEGASRVAYYKDNATLVTEGLDGKTLPGGSYTVKVCTHVYQYTHTTGATTHSQTCPACGGAKAAETCSYDAATGRCACGSTLAVTLPTDLALTYDGTAKTPAVTVTVDGTELAAEKYQINYDNNINAGNTAKVTVTAANGSFSGSVSSTFTIAPATLTIKANDQTITYGGSIATGTDQVTSAGLVGGDTLESVTLTPSSDQVAVADKTITPSAAVIKRGGEDAAENYNITYQPGALTINKAQAAVTGNPTANTLTYTGAAQALVTAGTASVGEVVYSLTETGTYSTTIPSGTNAGSYTVWYKVEGTTNYEGTDPVKVDVTISKVNYTGEKAGATSGKFGMTKTYNLIDLLPEGYVLGMITTTDANSIFEGTPTVSGTMLTYKLAESAEAGKTGTITVPVTESTNYNQFDLKITVEVTDKIVPTLTVTPISVPYTGSAVPAGAIHGTATADGKNIPGSWSFADGQALTNVADSGTKTVNFTPADEFKDDYAPATGTVRVTITKATPSLSLTPSPATLPNGGTVTLTLSGLPSGGSATVTCSDENITVTKGSGDTWTAELPAGGASYTFTASYSGDGNHNGASANCTVSVEKITPTLSLTANPASLRGGGTVTLTLSGLPAGGSATVTCSGGITVTAGAGNTWTATLPNSTASYTFTASYAGNTSYHGASASCAVETTEVTVLPNPPEAGDGKQYQVIMEDGISEVPAGLQSIETLNTPEKLETAMKTAITQVNSGIPQDNTAVYDVELQISTDGGATWTKATAANFPADGLTVTLPYPAGTNSSYTFTVVHMFTTSDFNKTPGDTETPRVTNTASGLQFTVTGLSPISVGWVQPSTPTTPTGPTGGGGGGGGWSSSTYAVTVERAEHGKVTSNRTNASSGSTVTLTATPDSGYVLDTLTVTDSRGNEIRLTAQGGGKYTFTMPSRAVTVKATFAPLPEDTEKPCDGGVDCPSHGFTDLGTVGTWYHEAVDYVLRNNLMGGYGNGLFGPNDTLTRAQFAQILYNKEGRPAVTGSSSFSDVAPGAWCAPAITWAAERGIVGGYGNGMFGPNDNITREQLAVMLWRYAGSPAATDKELHFNDADKASGYALDALRWAVENGIINGKGGGILDPKGLATRAQTAQILKNFMENR